MQVVEVFAVLVSFSAARQWPLDRDAIQTDEQRLAVYAEALGFTERDYDALVLDALRLTCSKSFIRLFEATTGLLERRPVLDHRMLYDIVLLTREGRRPHD